MTAQQNQNQNQDQKLGSGILQVDVVFFGGGLVREIPSEVYWSFLGELGGVIVRHTRGEVFCVGDRECVLGVWFGRVVDRCFRLDGFFAMDDRQVVAKFNEFINQ